MKTIHDSKADLAKELEENLVKFFTNLDVEISFTALHSRIETGIPHPLLNCIARTRCTAKNAPEQIEKTISHFKWRKLPFTWWTTEHSKPANLETLLETYGLTHLESFAGMVCDSLGPMPESGHSSSLEIVQVIDSFLMREWSAILEKVFLLNPSIAEAYSALYLQKAWLPDQYLRPYLALLNGTPIASLTLYVCEGCAEIYHLAILPEARSRGIGSAILEQLVGIAKDQDCRKLFIKTPTRTQKLFQRLGFSTFCRMEAYVWPGKERLHSAKRISSKR